MSHRPGTVERAYQLARTGEYETVRQIRSQLDREGYLDASSQITGAMLVRELARDCRMARASRLPLSLEAAN